MSALDLIIEYAERVGELSVTKIDAARAELDAARTAIEQAHIAMVRIGNKLNWNPPIDQGYADAINLLRAQAAELDAARNEAGAVDGVLLAELIHEMQEAIEQARELISSVAYGSWAPDNVRPEYRGWMYHNPAPQAEQEQTQ